jgi:endonuclease/exonuclease/phosphatase family metal-dependent hydrolase
MNPGVARIRSLAGMVEATALFLFVFQALRVLFSALFGLIYDALFAGSASMTSVGLVLVAVILALLAPLLAPRPGARPQAALLAGALLAFVARIPLTFNHPEVRLAAAVVLLAGGGLYLAARLREQPGEVPRALVLALFLDLLLRTGGQTWDLTLRQAWWPGQVAVSLGLAWLAAWLWRRRRDEQAPVGGGWGLATGLFWGGWLFLQTSLLAFPNALARWSGAPYALFAALWPAVMLLSLLGEELWRGRRGRLGAAAAPVLLLAGLAAGYLARGSLAFVGLLVAQLAALALLLTVVGPGAAQGRDRLGPGLALGGLLFLVLSFAYAFAFTYPYTLALFRGTGLPIFLAAGLLAGLPALGRPGAAEAAVPRPSPLWYGALFLAAGLAAGLSLAVAEPPAPPAPGPTLRAATYNIHYGYDSDWRLRLEEQAQAIEASGAGIVALQEVDAGRPTSYMIDNALWLSHRLGMEALYLPTLEHLSGIALLSRYPVLAWEGQWLPSELEQTGILWARLDVGGTPVNAFALWLGLEPEERARQLDAALPFVAARPGPAVWGGDFNANPDSPVYAGIAAAGWLDPFEALGLGSPPTDPAIGPRQRIDFVWLRGLAPVAAEVLDSTASDHRLVVVEAALP